MTDAYSLLWDKLFNMLKHEDYYITIGVRKEDAFGFVSAFLGRLEEINGYYVRIITKKSRNNNVILRTETEQAQAIIDSGKLCEQLSLHQTLLYLETCFLSKQYENNDSFLPVIQCF